MNTISIDLIMCEDQCFKCLSVEKSGNKYGTTVKTNRILSKCISKIVTSSRTDYILTKIQSDKFLRRNKHNSLGGRRT